MKNTLSPLYDSLSTREGLLILLDYLKGNHPRNQIRICELLEMVSISQTISYIMRGNRVIPHTKTKTLILWIHHRA